MDDETYRQRLARDLVSWRRAGLIDGDQEQAILARVGAADRSIARALRMGWIVSVVSIIGALVLAGGIVLLFASNWEDLPDWFRVAALIVGVAASYGGGYYLIYEAGLQRVGSALLLLGALIYQAGLFLLAQIYGMPVESPILFLLGAIGAFPLAYLFGSRIVLLLALVALVAWLMMTSATRYEDAEGWVTPIVLVLAGSALYAAGRLHMLRKSLEPFGDVYSLGGALLSLSVIYFAMFGAFWDAVLESDVEAYAAPALIYVLIAGVLALVVAQVVLRRPNAESAWDLAFQLLVVALAAVVATWPNWTGYAFICNVVFFAVAVGLVARGYTRGDERYVNAGLAVIGIGLVTRYIDTFWSQLAGSLFFMAGGLLLLLLAFVLERVRRGLLTTMDEQRNLEAPA
jgi:uncharacterized membrane protein